MGDNAASSFLGQLPIVQTDAVPVEEQPATAREAFEAFILNFQKSYQDDAEKEARFAIFKDNFEAVQAHNAAGVHSFELEINAFADLTSEEFGSMHGLQPGEPLLEGVLGGVPVLDHEYDNLTAPPAQVDWRKSGAVTEVKNQGQCGACWAFATTGALEGAWKIGTGALGDFSEQQFVDCAAKDWGMLGCKGGNVGVAVQYGAQAAICNEASYPYEHLQGECRASHCRVGIPLGGIKAVKRVPRTEAALMSAVAQQPVAVAVEADQISFQLYRGGIIQGASCGPKGVDHAVLLVGYGSEAGKDYWLVKNSWGSNWGESGYVRIGRGPGAAGGPYGVCRILTDPVYPVIDSSKSVPPNVTTSLVMGAVFLAVIASLCLFRFVCKRCSRGAAARDAPLLTTGPAGAAQRPAATRAGGRAGAPARQASSGGAAAGRGRALGTATGGARAPPTATGPGRQLGGGGGAARPAGGAPGVRPEASQALRGAA